MAPWNLRSLELQGRLLLLLRFGPRNPNLWTWTPREIESKAQVRWPWVWYAFTVHKPDRTSTRNVVYTACVHAAVVYGIYKPILRGVGHSWHVIAQYFSKAAIQVTKADKTLWLETLLQATHRAMTSSKKVCVVQNSAKPCPPSWKVHISRGFSGFLSTLCELPKHPLYNPPLSFPLIGIY